MQIENHKECNSSIFYIQTKATSIKFVIYHNLFSNIFELFLHILLIFTQSQYQHILIATMYIPRKMLFNIISILTYRTYLKTSTIKDIRVKNSYTIRLQN